jgi:hypothetical protein
VAVLICSIEGERGSLTKLARDGQATMNMGTAGHEDGRRKMGGYLFWNHSEKGCKLKVDWTVIREVLENHRTQPSPSMVSLWRGAVPISFATPDVVFSTVSVARPDINCGHSDIVYG